MLAQPSAQSHDDFDENQGTSPLQIISDIEPAADSTVSHMKELAQLRDNQPIRAACFSPSGNYFVLGTNSKSLKICSLPKLPGQDDDDDEEADKVDSSGGIQNEFQIQQVNVLLEQQNHHVGSIYCVDWSRTERLIATGSNDRLIKLLVCPDLEQNRHDQLLEMTLSGH